MQELMTDQVKKDRRFFKIAIPTLLLVLMLLFIYSNRRLINNPNKYTSAIDQAWKIRNEKAQESLKIFNDSIFKWISFRGIILDDGYDRLANEYKESVETYYVIVTLDKEVHNPKNTPLKVTRIYDLTNLQKAKIYWMPPKCMFDAENYGDSIVKNFGEDFYRIKFKTNKSDYPDTERCDKLYYTTDFDYFWTVKNIDYLIDSIYQANK